MIILKYENPLETPFRKAGLDCNLKLQSQPENRRSSGAGEGSSGAARGPDRGRTPKRAAAQRQGTPEGQAVNARSAAGRGAQPARARGAPAAQEGAWARAAPVTGGAETNRVNTTFFDVESKPTNRQNRAPGIEQIAVGRGIVGGRGQKWLKRVTGANFQLETRRGQRKTGPDSENGHVRRKRVPWPEPGPRGAASCG